MLNDKIVLLTGGTGSLSHKLIKRIFAEFVPKKVIVYSRDEFKQSEMAKRYDYQQLRFRLGDIRDKDRLNMTLKHVDYVIHTAALKQVPTLEYNPTEAVKTNVLGAMNLIEACVENDVKKLINTSTDKAVNPVNLYGATKLCAEKLFSAANAFAHTRFCSVRYGNVIGSRGSVIPHWLDLKRRGIKEFPVTHAEMTRFWITLDEAVDLVMYAFGYDSDKVLVPHIPSMKLVDMAKAIDSDCDINFTGIRAGEKMHETLIAKDENNTALLKGNLLNWGCEEYRSDANDLWMTKEQFKEKLCKSGIG